jgi:hypothetical protein
MDKLGHHVNKIITSVLEKWTEDMTKVIERLPFTKPIELGADNWEIMDQYVDKFKRAWEAEFGVMDDDEIFWVPISTDPAFVQIRSTGAAAKMFFCLMLLTRLQALERRRQGWRAISALESVHLGELPADVKDCHICREPLGVPNDDGEVEMPIRVLACCGNYFGVNCLRRWYGEFGNSACPLCKWTASPAFLEKLLFEEAAYGTDIDDNDDTDNSIESTDNIRYPTTGNDDDSEGDEVLSDHDGSGFGESSAGDDGELEEGEVKE